MKTDPVLQMTKMLEDIAQLKINAAITAQNVVIAEVLATLTKKDLLSSADITHMIGRIEAAAARFSNAPDTSMAIGNAALLLKHALLKEQSKPS